jgi:hypothetical protein
MNQTSFPQEQQKVEEPKKSFADTLISIVSRFLGIPAFIILHKALPDPDWVLNLDRILLFFATIAAIELLLHSARTVVVVLTLLCIAGLIYGSFTNGYGFLTLFKAYGDLIISLSNK